MENEINNPALNRNLRNLGGVDFFNLLLPNLIQLGFIIGIIIFIAVIIIGAIQWIISGGDKNGIEAAKSKITNAVLGLVLLLSIFAFIKAIESFFGIDIMSLEINIFN